MTDIYATEFMRMFEHYHFRAIAAKRLADAKKATDAAGVPFDKKKAMQQTLSLSEDDPWTDRYYQPGSSETLDRKLFAGTGS